MNFPVHKLGRELAVACLVKPEVGNSCGKKKTSYYFYILANCFVRNKERMSNNYFAPRTPTEIKLVELLGDVFSKKKIGIFDNFLELEGEAQVKDIVSKIVTTFGVDLSIKDITTSPTVFQVAGKISKKSVRAVVPVQKGEIRLSIGQRMIMTLEQMLKNQQLYVIPFVANLFGELNVSALKNAINKIVERHESLRATFRHNKDGKMVVRIKKTMEVQLPVTENGDVDEFISSELNKQFDFENGPLIRTSLLKCSEKHHVFVANFHHIVFDLISMYVFLSELAELYENGNSKLEEVTYQFSDFVNWKFGYLSSSKIENVKEFWKKQLDGIPRVLEFPTGRRKSVDGNTLYFELERELSEKVKKYCSTNKINYIFIVYLSVYQILLSKYSRQKKFAIGVPFTGRQHGNYVDTIGFFVNVLPFPVNIDGGCSFNDFVQTTKSLYYGVYQNQSLPFETILNLIRCERGISKFENPLFQFVFNVISGINYLKSKMKNLKVEEIYPNVPISKFNLTLTVYEKDGQVKLGFEYSTDLFKKETIVRLFKYYSTLLERLLNEPQKEIGKVSLLPKEEFDRQVFEWNKNVKKYPKGTFQEMFEKVVDENPSGVAVEFEDKTITYRELNIKSNQIAHLLINRYKIKPGDFIAISVERSIELIVCMIGIIKSGGVFFPLDPTYPQERLNFMTNDTKPPLLIINSKFSTVFEDFIQEKSNFMTNDAKSPLLIMNSKFSAVYKEFKEVLVFEEYVSFLSEQSKKNPNIDITPDDLLYIVYTSGSTGEPKGVLVEHRGALNFCYNHLDLIKLEKGDKIVFNANIIFDASILDILPTLLGGLTLVVYPEKYRFDCDKIFEIMDKRRVNCCFFTPGQLKLLPKRKLPHLKTLMTGAESCDFETMKFWSENVPNFVHLYGPSEGSVVSHHKFWTLKEMATNIGRTTNNVLCYILDDDLNPIPIGVPGELHIAGECVSRGYLNREKLTSEKFIKNPFVSGGKMYKTGDLCYYLSNGDVIFQGRIDSQIKIRGFRVELCDIENHLRKDPTIGDVVVLKRDERLVAYVVLNITIKNKKELTREFKRNLVSELPRYMVPSFFHYMDKLPLNSSNKIDRKKLLQLKLERTDSLKTPNSKIEKDLVEIYSKVLKIPSISVEDHVFYDLGADSLSLQTIYRQLPQYMKDEISVDDIYHCTTIRLLSARLSEGKMTFPVLVPKTKKEEEDLAIIGISCRFPDADDHDAFFKNLLDKKVCRKFYSLDQVKSPFRTSPNFVPVSYSMNDIKGFDYEFFGIEKDDAEIINPHFRIFLECAYNCLEDAGYVDTDNYNGEIGIVSSIGSYFIDYFVKLIQDSDSIMDRNLLRIQRFNSTHTFAGFVAYYLGLKGPSLCVQTACSSSLSGLNVACKSILANECDMCLVGGVSVNDPDNIGYLHYENTIFSKDGFARTFDKNASGTVMSSGCGIVLVKRLSDAVKDRDHIYAVIKGSGMNNDGGKSINRRDMFSPKRDTQSVNIIKTLLKCGINPETISFIETHGTGTTIGDPVEIGSLKDAFRNFGVKKKEFIRLGALKQNVGHLDTAAGIAGVIKTSLMLKYKVIPGLCLFSEKSDLFSIENSPFVLSNETTKWKGEFPRIAGVSSVGMTGTNAHVILEETEERKIPKKEDKEHHLIVLSANTVSAFKSVSIRLKEHINQRRFCSYTTISDVAYTLQVGRKPLKIRSFFVSSNKEDLLEYLNDDQKVCFEVFTVPVDDF
jgi:amino acid adenylation domain-containing protein